MQSAQTQDSDRIRVEIRGEESSDVWNERLRQISQGSYRQTTHYAVIQRQFGEMPVYLCACDRAGNVLGQLLLLFGSRYSWGLNRRPLSSVTVPLATRLFPQCRWSDGPLVFDTDRCEEIGDLLLKKAIYEARARKCREVRAIAPLYGEVKVDYENGCGRLFSENGFDEIPTFTLLVNLSYDDEQLWGNVKKEGRTKVRKAQSQGIEIMEVNGDDNHLRMAHEVMKETAERNKKVVLSFDDFRHSFNYHFDLGVERSFLSTWKGKPLSFQRAIVFNRNVRLGNVSYSDFSREQKLYGNDLMQWHIIKWAKGSGHLWLDYGGVEPKSEDPKMQSIYKFKKKWGGELAARGNFVAKL